MTTALNLIEKFEQMQCGECGIYFYVPDHFYHERLNTKKKWQCPNGHSRVFCESEVDRLKKELETAQSNAKNETKKREWAEMKSKKLEKSIVRLKQRVGNGVCPCCKRSFSNLQRHMTCKHPDFKESGSS